MTVVCVSRLSPTFINLYKPDAEYKYNRSNVLLSTAFSEPTSYIYIFPTRQKKKHFIPIILLINIYIFFAFLSICLHLSYTESVNIQANAPC